MIKWPEAYTYTRSPSLVLGPLLSLFCILLLLITVLEDWTTLVAGWGVYSLGGEYRFVESLFFYCCCITRCAVTLKKLGLSHWRYLVKSLLLVILLPTSVIVLLVCYASLAAQMSSVPRPAEWQYACMIIALSFLIICELVNLLLSLTGRVSPDRAEPSLTDSREGLAPQAHPSYRISRFVFFIIWMVIIFSIPAALPVWTVWRDTGDVIYSERGSLMNVVAYFPGNLEHAGFYNCLFYWHRENFLLALLILAAGFAFGLLISRRRKGRRKGDGHAL
jgi:hypothetical protein